MRPQNSISALADDRHLYKPSLASVNQSKSILTTVNAEHLHQQRTSKASEAESHSPIEHTRVAPDTKTLSSNSSLSVQSSSPMDLVSTGSQLRTYASSAFSDRSKSVEPSHLLLHSPFVPQDKQSNSSSSSFSNWKPLKYGFQMAPHNSIYAFEGNPHLYKPFSQDTGSQLRTYASSAFSDRSKSVEPSACTFCSTR